MADLDQLNTLGETVSRMNPDVGQARASYLLQVPDVMITLPSGHSSNQKQLALRGWNIGTAVSMGHTVAGPGQDEVRQQAASDTWQGGFVEDDAFAAARTLQYQLTAAGRTMNVTGTETALSADRLAQIDSLAGRGQTMALSIPAVSAASMSEPGMAFQKAFMVATAFCQGNSLPGPAQDALKMDLMNLYGYATPEGAAAGRGFSLGQAVQFGITRSRLKGTAISNDPSFAAGQLAVAGIAGQPLLTADQKAGVVSSIAGNPAAKAGAQSQIAVSKPGVWKRFLSFIGLA